MERGLKPPTAAIVQQRFSPCTFFRSPSPGRFSPFFTTPCCADGGVTDAQIVKEIGEGCDDEALRVVQSMPKWAPAEVGSKPVRCRMTLPVRFALGSLHENAGRKRSLLQMLFG